MLPTIDQQNRCREGDRRSFEVKYAEMKSAFVARQVETGFQDEKPNSCKGRIAYCFGVTWIPISFLLWNNG